MRKEVPLPTSDSPYASLDYHRGRVEGAAEILEVFLSTIDPISDETRQLLDMPRGDSAMWLRCIQEHRETLKAIQAAVSRLDESLEEFAAAVAPQPTGEEPPQPPAAPGQPPAARPEFKGIPW